MKVVQVDELVLKGVETLFSCIGRGRAGDWINSYKTLLRQRYIPWASVETLESHGAVFKCAPQLAKWLSEFAKVHGADVDLEEAYLARSGFVLAFLIAKHILEYQMAELPGDVKTRLNEMKLSWLGVDLTLDDIVGQIWPTLLSIVTTGRTETGKEPIEVVKHFNKNVRELSERVKGQGGRSYWIFKMIPTPLAYFNVVSEAYGEVFMQPEKGQARYRYVISGFGNFVVKLLDDYVLSSKYLTVDTVVDIVRYLRAISYAHMSIVSQLTDALRRDWYGISKAVEEEYLKRGGAAGLYTKMEARIDMANYILGAIDHYHSLDDEEAKRLLAQYIWLDYLRDPQTTLEIVAKRFFAKLVRLW